MGRQYPGALLSHAPLERFHNAYSSTGWVRTVQTWMALKRHPLQRRSGVLNLRNTEDRLPSAVHTSRQSGGTYSQNVLLLFQALQTGFSYPLTVHPSHRQSDPYPFALSSSIQFRSKMHLPLLEVPALPEGLPYLPVSFLPHSSYQNVSRYADPWPDHTYHNQSHWQFHTNGLILHEADRLSPLHLPVL